MNQFGENYKWELPVKTIKKSLTKLNYRHHIAFIPEFSENFQIFS